MGGDGMFKQFLAAGIANIASIGLGVSFAWTSPSIPKLRDIGWEDNPMGRIPTLNEESWITALLPLGAFLSPFVAGPMSKIIGRKWTLMTSGGFFFAAFLILGLGNSIAFIFVARILQGFGCGIINTTLPMYSGEIASVEYRGAIGSLMQLFFVIGVLFLYGVGPFVSYNSLQWICLAIPAVFAMTFIFMPESPNYLLSKGKKGEAMAALKFLRGKNASSERLENELNEIQLDNDLAQNSKGKFGQLFKDKGNLRALIIVCVLMASQQLCGMDVVLYNSQTIFERTESNIEAEISTIALGAVLVVSGFFTLFLIEKMGRKLILLISVAGMAVTLGIMGLFFYLDYINSSVISSILWLPVTSLIVYVFAYNIGMGPIPWTLLSELFSVEVKSYASTISTSVCWGFSFVLALSFESINAALGIYWSFWIFAICCIGSFTFIFFVIFETKGMTLQDIVDRLNGHKRKNYSEIDETY